MWWRNLRRILEERKRNDWIVFFVLLVFFTALGHVLSSHFVWITPRAYIYQVLSSFGPPTRYPQRTAIVLLDDVDYWTDAPTGNAADPQLAGRSPTNRAYLAALIGKLAEAHVGVIVLDFDLRSPNANPASHDLPEYGVENEILFKAIKNACKHSHQIVLATELAKTPDGLAETRNIYDPAGLPESCMHKGYIELPRDIRRVPVAVPLVSHGSSDSLALAAVKTVDTVAHDRVTNQDETDFPYSQFLPLSAFHKTDPGRTLFTGTDILNADLKVLTPQLLSRIVLIGANWHTLALGQGALTDSHPTPSGALPGVLVHANYIEAALQNGTAKPFPEALAEVLEILLVLSLSILGILEIHWAWKWSAVLVSSFAVLIFSYLLLHTFGIMLDFFFPLIGVGIHSLYEHIHEWRHIARLHGGLDGAQKE